MKDNIVYFIYYISRKFHQVFISDLEVINFKGVRVEQWLAHLFPKAGVVSSNQCQGEPFTMV